MINWKTVPAVRMLVPLCFGIFSAVILPDYFSFCLIGSIFVLPFLIVLAVKEKINYQFRWWFGILLSIFWFLVGYYSVGNHDDFYQAQFYAKFVSSKEENRLLLQIDDLPVLKNKIKLYAKVLECNGQKARGNLLLYVDTTAQNKQLEYGDIVEVVSQLQAIEGPKNPNAYDFQNVMKLKNVRFSGYSKAENISLLAKNRGNFLMHLAYRAQKKLLEVLSTYIRDPNAFSVGSALILGYRSDISEELTQAYVNTGAMHVLSVSGLHVGLVASLFGWIIGRWRNGKRYWKITEVLLQVLFVWGFALITGASSCVLRAAVMFSFTIISRAFSRDANTYNSLIASAFFLLLYNPYFLFDISFQLSYAGLLGILYFHPYIFGWGQLKFQLISEYYLLNQIWSLTAVSLAAMLTTTPLSLYYFHQFPGSFWISGLIVVPLATLVLYAGLFLFAISKFFLFAYWVGKFLELVILGMNYSLSCIEKIPPGVIRDFWLERNETALWYLVVALLAAALHERRIIWLKYGLFLTVILGMKFNLSVFFARQQHFIVFYEAGREILIDVFKGKEVLSVKSSEISDKQIQFAAYNNRIAHQIARTDVQYLSIVDSLPKTKVLNIEGYSLLLLSDEHQVDLIPPNTFFKYILIYDNPRLDFELLQNKVKFSKIVIAADNTLKSLQFYKKECLARGIPCHDIKLDGTLVEAFDE